MAPLSLLQFSSRALEELKRDYKDEEMVAYTIHGVEAQYYHYLCDGEDDRGWGCGYRTLQSLCSWACNMSSTSHSSCGSSMSVPSLRKIQELLVEVGDKSASFVGSCQWIGCYESSIVLDQQYGVSSRLLHVRSGAQVGEIFLQLKEHFIKMVAAPVMIGGDADAASKTLIGIAHCNGQRIKYLIAHPHYCGNDDIDSIFTEKAVKWYETEQLFAENSFYNFCLPITKQ